MTPLAHRIVKELTLPKAKRTFVDLGGLLPRMSDIHCFETSECRDLALDMLYDRKGKKIDAKAFSTIAGIAPITSFLPADHTWIEWRRNGKERRDGALLYMDRDRIAFLAARQKGGIFFSVPQAIPLPTVVDGLSGMTVPLPNLDQYAWPDRSDITEAAHELTAVGMMLHMFLSFINTPKVFGRRQHMPHRGLEVKLIAAQPTIGKFPLRAWTEIKLEIAVPKDLSEEADHKAHLTGRKALHFCRAHLRNWNGGVVWVKPHWRGDASLGIKRSRYNVMPPATGGGAPHA